MRRPRSILSSRAALVALTVAFVAAPSTLAADWPQWGRDASKNMVADEKGLPTDFNPGEAGDDGDTIDIAKTKGLRWIAKLGSAANASW